MSTASLIRPAATTAVPISGRELAVAFRAVCSGDVLTRDDASFPAAAFGIDPSGAQPEVVVIAAVAGDVAATVRLANRAGRRVVMQAAGGLSGPAAAAGSPIVLIVTRLLAKVRIDPSSRTARVGAGASWRQVQQAAAEFGLTAVSGPVPGTGALGDHRGERRVGAGAGFSPDHIHRLEVVTPRGVQIVLERHDRPDRLPRAAAPPTGVRSGHLDDDRTDPDRSGVRGRDLVRRRRCAHRAAPLAKPDHGPAVGRDDDDRQALAAGLRPAAEPVAGPQRRARAVHAGRRPGGRRTPLPAAAPRRTRCPDARGRTDPEGSQRPGTISRRESVAREDLAQLGQGRPHLLRRLRMACSARPTARRPVRSQLSAGRFKVPSALSGVSLNVTPSAITKPKAPVGSVISTATLTVLPSRISTGSSQPAEHVRRDLQQQFQGFRRQYGGRIERHRDIPGVQGELVQPEAGSGRHVDRSRQEPEIDLLVLSGSASSRPS